MAKINIKLVSYDLQGKTHPDTPLYDDGDLYDFYITNYVSSSSLARRIKDTSYPGRCGKVKRAPTTLSELEGDDVDYYLTDDVYYEDRR